VAKCLELSELGPRDSDPGGDEITARGLMRGHQVELLLRRNEERIDTVVRLLGAVAGVAASWQILRAPDGNWQSEGNVPDTFRASVERISSHGCESIESVRLSDSNLELRFIGFAPPARDVSAAVEAVVDSMSTSSPTAYR